LLSVDSSFCVPSSACCFSYFFGKLYIYKAGDGMIVGCFFSRREPILHTPKFGSGATQVPCLLTGLNKCWMRPYCLAIEHALRCHLLCHNSEIYSTKHRVIFLGELPKGEDRTPRHDAINKEVW